MIISFQFYYHGAYLFHVDFPQRTVTKICKPKNVFNKEFIDQVKKESEKWIYGNRTRHPRKGHLGSKDWKV